MVLLHVPAWGTEKTKADAYFDRNPSPFIYEADTNRKGIDDGHILSNAVRVSWAVTGKDKISVYHDDQRSTAITGASRRRFRPRRRPSR